MIMSATWGTPKKQKSARRKISGHLTFGRFTAKIKNAARHLFNIIIFC